MTASPKCHAARKASLSLTRRQLAELDAFLSLEAASSGLLSVEALHGFLTAIALLPVDIETDRWLFHVWSDHPRKASNSGTLHQAERLRSYMRRMYDDIVAALANPEQSYVPLTAAGCGEEWCRGFLQGMALLNTHWRLFLAGATGRRLLLPIFLLGAETIPAKWRGLVSTAEKRAGLLACIPAIIEAMGTELLILELKMAIQGKKRPVESGDDAAGDQYGDGGDQRYVANSGSRRRPH